MGGSGGRYFPSYTPQEFQEKVQKAEDAAKDDVYEGEANGLLASYLAQFNDRDVDSINQVLEKAKAELSDEFEGTVDLLFGGSVAKKTYVDGLSDVDALLLLKHVDAAHESPADIKETCAARLREIFGPDKVAVGCLAITVEKDGSTIQFLPALRAGEHFKISNAEGTEWAKIRPRVFAESLTKANGDLGNKLVPTIKLAKAIIGQLPEQRRLSGYHIEALALKVFEGYNGEIAARPMLKHFFEHVGPRLQQPMTDITGQSDHVDDYLGATQSLQRRVMADACDRISRRLKAADAAKDLAQWRQIFGDVPE
jgi:hypothetical protein